MKSSSIRRRPAGRPSGSLRRAASQEISLLVATPRSRGGRDGGPRDRSRSGRTGRVGSASCGTCRPCPTPRRCAWSKLMSLIRSRHSSIRRNPSRSASERVSSSSSGSRPERASCRSSAASSTVKPRRRGSGRVGLRSLRATFVVCVALLDEVGPQVPEGADGVLLGGPAGATAVLLGLSGDDVLGDQVGQVAGADRTGGRSP